jgi:hypothetical protein
MAAITAGGSALFLVAAQASDNSTPQLSNITLTADDAAVSIAVDPSDASGATFSVTVPASDVATTFNLTAKADVASSTSLTPQPVVSLPLPVTISPAAVPVTFTLTVSEK